MRRATNGHEQAPYRVWISIHALLAESDQSPPSITPTAGRNFYPRSPCGERQARSERINRDIAFLSTLSLRRATQTAYFFLAGERISIHALLAESDSELWMALNRRLFLSTLSLRRATKQLIDQRCKFSRFLSTLSLRRATGNKCCKGSNDSNFYPRSPCGERPPPAPQGESSKKFLSTLSLRRATLSILSRYQL